MPKASKNTPRQSMQMHPEDTSTVQVQKKHLFLVRRGDNFFARILENLVSLGEVNPNVVLIGFFGNEEDGVDEYFLGFSRFELDSACSWDFSGASSVSLLSLNLHNASIASQVLEDYGVSAKKFLLFLTDDEVDRWSAVYSQQGCLVEDPKAHINREVLSVLGKAKNFVVPEVPFGLRLKEILRRPIRVCDAFASVTLLGESKVRMIDELKSLSLPRLPSSKRVLFGTKPGRSEYSHGKVLSALARSLNRIPRFEVRERIVLGLWNLPLNQASMRSLLSFLVVFSLVKLIAKKKRITVSVEFLSPMDIGRYILTIHSFDCLFLQGRGGGSTAFEFLRHHNDLFLPEGSFNDALFRHYLPGSSKRFSSLRMALQMQISEMRNKHQEGEKRGCLARDRLRHVRAEGLRKIRELLAELGPV